MEERGDQSQVLFLGTGSAEPSKYRGSAGLHVRLGPGRGFLLDAGEGSWGALVRHYGLEQARAEVRARRAWHECCFPAALHMLHAQQPHAADAHHTFQAFDEQHAPTAAYLTAQRTICLGSFLTAIKLCMLAWQ